VKTETKTTLLVDANRRTAGNWTFRPFVSSPHWTYSTFPQRFLPIQLKPKHVFRAVRAVRCFVTPLYSDFVVIRPSD